MLRLVLSLYFLWKVGTVDSSLAPARGYVRLTSVENPAVPVHHHWPQGFFYALCIHAGLLGNPYRRLSLRSPKYQGTLGEKKGCGSRRPTVTAMVFDSSRPYSPLFHFDSLVLTCRVPGGSRTSRPERIQDLSQSFSFGQRSVLIGVGWKPNFVVRAWGYVPSNQIQQETVRTGLVGSVAPSVEKI